MLSTILMLLALDVSWCCVLWAPLPFCVLLFELLVLLEDVMFAVFAMFFTAVIVLSDAVVLVLLLLVVVLK